MTGTSTGSYSNQFLASGGLVVHISTLSSTELAPREHWRRADKRKDKSLKTIPRHAQLPPLREPDICGAARPQTCRRSGDPGEVSSSDGLGSMAQLLADVGRDLRIFKRGAIDCCETNVCLTLLARSLPSASPSPAAFQTGFHKPTRPAS